MHDLAAVVDPTGSGTNPDNTPLPKEAGVFRQQVRPIFERVCGGCHSETSPDAGLSFGGRISSADVVKALVGVTAIRGGQFKRVVGNSS